MIPNFADIPLGEPDPALDAGDDWAAWAAAVREWTGQDIDALGLDTWLRRENYKIPEGAAPILRPYVQGGMKFFVAKVDPKKVTFENGQAMLSPLRFHYDSDTFSLPIRLGLVNSAGTQDLIVHVLGADRKILRLGPEIADVAQELFVASRVKGFFGVVAMVRVDAVLQLIAQVEQVAVTQREVTHERV